VEIRELVWDAANTRHLAAHGIDWWEVDELIVLDAWAVGPHPDYPDQIRVTGPTAAGRLITVAMEPTDDPAVWRPITGWDATAGERAYYQEQHP
jgi:hypothetical protein